MRQNNLSAKQLLSNIQLDQYDQVSCTDPNAEITASFGPLRLNSEGETYFDLSEKIDFDPFHPLFNSEDLDKFHQTYEKSSRKEEIDKLVIKLLISKSASYQNREITLSNTNLTKDQLLQHGIKGNFVDSSTIKLYLPLAIKNKHITDITNTLNKLCT